MYQKVIALRPYFEVAVFDLAALYEKQGKTNEAIAFYRGYYEKNRTRLNVRIKIAELLIKEKKYEEALAEYQSLLNFDPNNREARLRLGILYYDMRRYKSAVVEFSTILKNNSADDRVRYLLASSYEEDGNKTLALEEYKKISTQSELYATAQIHSAMLLSNEGKTREAIHLIREALKINNRHVPSYLYLSSLYEKVKDNVAAENVLREGIALYPDNIDLRYALGVICEKMSRFDESIKEMETILRLDPDHAEALNFIGYSYADRGINLEEAEKMISKALQLKPDNGYIIDSLGWVHFKQSKLESALTHLKRALELLPDDYNVIEHLGDVYVKLGKLQEAQKMYERASKLVPENDLLKKKLFDLKKEIR